MDFFVLLLEIMFYITPLFAYIILRAVQEDYPSKKSISCYIKIIITITAIRHLFIMKPNIFALIIVHFVSAILFTIIGILHFRPNYSNFNFRESIHVIVRRL